MKRHLCACLATVLVQAAAAATPSLRDVPYGGDREQRMDVYLPARAADAPVLFLVHGGAWRIGDKHHGRVVDNKVARWLPQGFIVVSVNYRMLPDADPLMQADDVARALAQAQRQAPSWGGDPAKFILMGHSAGAHLVSLLDAQPARALRAGARGWLGTVALDSAAYDVTRIMGADHPRLYDRAFGSDPAFWSAASPAQQLVRDAAPLLAVCSTQRRDLSCDQAQDFADKAKALAVRVQVLGQPLSHGEINETLGLAGTYTDTVEAFMASLDPQVARRLGR